MIYSRTKEATPCRHGGQRGDGERRRAGHSHGGVLTVARSKQNIPILDALIHCAFLRLCLKNPSNHSSAALPQVTRLPIRTANCQPAAQPPAPAARNLNHPKTHTAKWGFLNYYFLSSISHIAWNSFNLPFKQNGSIQVLKVLSACFPCPQKALACEDTTLKPITKHHRQRSGPVKHISL